MAAWTGQPYGYGDAAQDFLWGAAFAGAGRAAGAFAARPGGLPPIDCAPPPSGGFPSRPYLGRTTGELADVNVNDPAATALAARIGGRPSVRFTDDPINREFDAVSHRFVAQSKPANFTLNKKFRDQVRATFEAAVRTGRVPYFHFEGPPGPGVIKKLQEYGARYGVQPVIDTKRLGG
ncbi:restriction endonuclease fold toxin [Micromonospora sp. NPDC050276]|uniref:restriction endonuclease fold toxin n=1 Tax=Micromonospora sp. NPDC050276 TaxID=3364278 RepID=UPI0037893928